MAVKLTVATYYDPTGIEAAHKALAKFQKAYTLTEDDMQGSIGLLAEQSLKWQRYGMRVQWVGETAQKAGATLTKGLTVPIAGLAAVSAKAAIDMEASFAQVRKTVDATDEVYQQLYDDAVALSTVHAISAADVATLESLAAQLGVATQNLDEFAEIAYSLDIATNLNAEEAITQLAQFINITGNSQENAERLASTVVALGNTSATTEADILGMSMRIAAAGSQAGMTDQDILALSAALASLGMEAEAGGTAMSKTIMQISKDAATGSENLQVWAELAGMSVDEFVAAWQTGGDVTTETFTRVVQGMATASDESGRLLVLLDELGISSIRQSDAMQRLAGSGDLLTRSIATANEAYSENTALAREVANFEDTLASKWAITANKAKAAAIEMGGPMVDALSDLLDAAEPMLGALANGAKAFSDLSKEQQRSIMKIAGVVAALGPLTTAAGKLTSTVGKAMQAYGKLEGALAAHQAAVKQAAKGAEAEAAALAKAEKQTKAFTAASKAAAAAMGMLAAATIVKTLNELWYAASGVAGAFEDALNASTSWGEQLAQMQGHGLDASTAISEYGRSLDQLDSIVNSSEQAVTTILATAIAERRDLREDEVEDIYANNAAIAEAEREKFNTYLAALDTEAAMLMAEEDELTTKEAAQYVANIEKKYAVAVAVAEEGYEKQVNLINQHYSATGQLGSDAYKKELDAAKQARDDQLRVAAERKDALERQTAEMMTALSESEARGWAEIARQTETLEMSQLSGLQRAQASWGEFIGANKSLVGEYQKMLSEMDYETASAFLAMQATIVQGGGKMTAENQQMVNDILDALDDMPPGFDKAAKDALLKMISGMEEYWPWVNNAADMTADQIIEHMRAELDAGDSYSIGYGQGENLTKGYAAGTMSTAALKAISSKVNSMVDYAKQSLARAQQSFSPARAFMPYGEYATLGYAEGMEDTAALQGVTTAARSAVDAAMDGYASPLGIGAQTPSYGFTGASTGAGVVNNYWNVTLSANDASEMQSWEDFWRRAQERAQRVERMG